jgi:hypothetical protein
MIELIVSPSSFFREREQSQAAAARPADWCVLTSYFYPDSLRQQWQRAESTKEECSLGSRTMMFTEPWLHIER